MNFKINNLSKINNIKNYLESKGGSSSNTISQSSSNITSQCVKGDISLSNCPAISPCYSKESYLCYNKDGSIPLNIINPKKLSKEELSNLASIGLQKNITCRTFSRL